MATITYFKSATDDGGAIGTQLTDGGVTELFPIITSQNRLTGLNYYRKAWYNSDEALTIMCSLANLAEYNASFFESAGVNDVVGDLTGSETRYGALNIVSNTTTSVKVTDNTLWTLARVNDYAHIGDTIVQIDTITDNGDGTSDIAFSPAIVTADHSGTAFSTTISKNFTAGVDVPFWINVDVPVLAQPNSNYDTHQFMALY